MKNKSFLSIKMFCAVVLSEMCHFTDIIYGA